MKEYMTPEIEILTFGVGDVLTLSSENGEGNANAVSGNDLNNITGDN